MKAWRVYTKSVFNPWLKNFQFAFLPACSIFASQLNFKFMSQKIGFVGVGRMGANMARRLQETGFTIAAVFDTNKEAAEALAKELNCVPATDLKSVTALSEIIITVV